MRKKLLSLVVIAIGVLGLTAPLALPTPALAMTGAAAECGCDAATGKPAAGKNTTKCITQCGICATDPDKCTGSDLGGIVKNIINVMLFIIGTVSVIMIIYGGVRYVLSAGNADHVKSAKNTILYAIVGLVVALLAYAIVNFVISSF